MSGVGKLCVPLACALAVLPRPEGVAAQSLADRLAGLEGQVTFHYAGREGLEGCGDGSISFGEHKWYRSGGRRSDAECGPGPVLVTLTLRDGQPRDVETRVGPRVHLDAGRDGDLGRVLPAEAAGYLLHLAETARPSVAEDAIFPAFLAKDVEVWPRLIALARDGRVADDVRSQALFWVGQEAAGIGTAGLADVARDEDEDHKVRSAAVFALSQRPDGEGVPVLMEVARDADDAETRKAAMFWLAQSDDPMVLDFFEEILAAGR